MDTGQDEHGSINVVVQLDLDVGRVLESELHRGRNLVDIVVQRRSVERHLWHCLSIWHSHELVQLQASKRDSRVRRLIHELMRMVVSCVLRVQVG